MNDFRYVLPHIRGNRLGAAAPMLPPGGASPLQYLAHSLPTQAKPAPNFPQGEALLHIEANNFLIALCQMAA